MEKFNINKKNNFIQINVLVDKFNAQVAHHLKTELFTLDQQNEKNILIDLSKSNYCDSSGLNAILTANRICKTNGGKFVLCGLKPAIEKLIKISKLDSALRIVNTPLEGKRQFR